MDWMWTWGGKCFGYRDGNDLWTYDGRHVGRFQGDDVYGPDGTYLGEIRNGNRLIRNRAKANRRASSFSPYNRRVGHVKHVNYVGNVMYVGYEDFPASEEF